MEAEGRPFYLMATKEYAKTKKAVESKLCLLQTNFVGENLSDFDVFVSMREKIILNRYYNIDIEETNQLYTAIQNTIKDLPTKVLYVDSTELQKANREYVNSEYKHWMNHFTERMEPLIRYAYGKTTVEDMKKKAAELTSQEKQRNEVLQMKPLEFAAWLKPKLTGSLIRYEQNASVVVDNQLSIQVNSNLPRDALKACVAPNFEYKRAMFDLVHGGLFNDDFMET